MTHRFPVKEIALQSGLSTATVDRVLNRRAHVSPQTHRRVHDAIDELVRQEKQLAARGRRLFFDIVVEAPNRFSREIRAASESLLDDFRPTALRPRFSFSEMMTEDRCCRLLEQIGKRGSQGVCLKVRDTARVRQSIAGLKSKNIPVVTIFTDLPGSGRLAYAGLDNDSAGRTAAYFMHKLLPPQAGAVLTTLSQHAFQGEEERFQGFCSELLSVRPDLRIVDASGGGGLTPETWREVADRVRSGPTIAGVYSMGGGNLAVLRALADAGQSPEVFIAHDLDEDNLELLRGGRLTLVLYHDLRTDMRNAFRHLQAFHGIGMAPRVSRSDIQVITPMNLPSPCET